MLNVEVKAEDLHTAAIIKCKVQGAGKKLLRIVPGKVKLKY